ncbi:MAG TPA: chorismate mutase [Methanocorpusculum sp.]|nr:chorismate mutase [Methanocorpusculum sp.]
MPEIDASAEIFRLRSEIADIDCKIVQLAAERMRCAEEIGKFKKLFMMDVRVPAVEEAVKARYISEAQKAGLSPECASKLAEILIAEAKQVQMQ